MLFLSRHAALFILAFVVLSLVIAWQRLPVAADAGILTLPIGRRLLLRVFAFFAIVFGAQEAIVLTAGWPSALCLYTRPPSDPFVIAMWAVQFLASAWVLWWVWRDQGAIVLGRLGALLETRAEPTASIPPARVRAFVTLIVAAGVLTSALALSGLWLWPTVDPDVCAVRATAA
jgi:hypothetical protein